MRKKYLSALLFGALLFASAGTFTSCKDYDDDINNLQEQINTVKTDLENLKATVEGLDGVKTLSYADGMLIIETGKGTKVEVPVPSATGVTTVELKDNVLYVDGKEAGKVEIAEGEAVKVEVKEDGKLYINGEVQDLEIGSKVAVVDNNDGTYTLSVDGKSYVLPKATSSVLVSVWRNSNDGYAVFTNSSFKFEGAYGTPGTPFNTNEGGIYWGTADQLLNPWNGPKTVVKGQLLTGQAKTIDVEVRPATFDLSAEDGLTLVNSLGEVAPVKVKAVAYNYEDPFTSGSRAADALGFYRLQITMDETVTADNIAKVFANKDNTQNMCYALALDGKVLSYYNIIIDTQTGKTSTVNVNENNVNAKFTKGTAVKGLTDIPVGKSTTLYLTSSDASVDYLYDSYIEIKDTNKAGRYGISANGMTITTTSAAAQLPASETVAAVLHMIDINGKQYKKEIEISCAAAEIGEAAIAPQEFKVIPNFSGMVVDLADVFTSLTDADADAISNGSSSNLVIWETTADAATIASTSGVITGSDISYYKTKEDALAGTNAVSLGTEKESIKDIKFAVINKNSFKTNAKAGVNNFTITLTDGKGNQLKKVTAKVTVTLPSFDDVIAPNTQYSTWDGDNYVARLSATQSGGTGAYVGSISFNNAFISKLDANGEDFFNKEYIKLENKEKNAILSYSLTYTDPTDGKVKEIAQTNLNDLIDATKGEFKVSTLNVVATAKVLDYETMTITKEFVVNLKSIFAGGEVVYYGSDNKPATVVNLSKTNNLIATGVVPADGKLIGMVATFNTKNAAFNPNATVSVGGIDLINSGSFADGKDVKYSIALASGSQGTSTVKEDGSGIQIDGCTEGKSGKVVITFVDVLGIKTTSEIGYTKIVE